MCSAPDQMLTTHQHRKTHDRFRPSAPAPTHANQNGRPCSLPSAHKCDRNIDPRVRELQCAPATSIADADATPFTCAHTCSRCDARAHAPRVFNDRRSASHINRNSESHINYAPVFVCVECGNAFRPPALLLPPYAN